MKRRQFLKTSALVGASAATLGLAGARAQQIQTDPRRIIMGGYGPSTTSFSRGLDRIGELLAARFGDDVESRFIYNVSDVGYAGAPDLHWLVGSGVLTLAYATMSTGIPELEIAALPFLFRDTASARAAMDGELGAGAIRRIEAENNYRVLGFFENGFRHVSNDIRPVRTPADLAGLSIRCLGVQARTFELLGAEPTTISLADALPLLEDGTIDGQENPFENTVSYGPYRWQRFHTATFHSYLSRPIFVHRQTYDSWSTEWQNAMRGAVREAVAYQRDLHDQAEIESQRIIRGAGGEIIKLTEAERASFVDAVAPIYADARASYDPVLLALVGL
ncbi:MAG TPA: TRAP transporter substrate-binding protein DctP [Gammaproteobacteria bacterium]